MDTEEKKHETTISAQALVDLILTTCDEQTKKKKTKETTIKEIHCQAMDDLVNVNSLFTVAAFVGLSLATRDKTNLEQRDECDAGPQVKKILIVYEVLAFACFLLSSMLAKVIKLHLYLDGSSYVTILGTHSYFRRKAFNLKIYMLIVAAVMSIVAIVFLMLAVVNIVQVRIGLLSCGSVEARAAVWAMCWIVGIGLVIYVVSMVIAISASKETDSVHVTDRKSDGELMVGEAGKSKFSYGV